MLQVASLRPHRLVHRARGGPCWRFWRDSSTDRGWDRERLGQSDEAPDSRPLLCSLGEVGPAVYAQASSGQARPESSTPGIHHRSPRRRVEYNSAGRWQRVCGLRVDRPATGRAHWHPTAQPGWDAAAEPGGPLTPGQPPTAETTCRGAAFVMVSTATAGRPIE